MDTVKEIVEDLHKTHKEFMEKNDARILKLEKGEHFDAYSEEILERLNGRLGVKQQLLDAEQREKEFQELMQKNIEELKTEMAKGLRPAAGGNSEPPLWSPGPINVGVQPSSKEYFQAYSHWMRKGENAIDIKQMTEGTTTEGGFLVPQVLADFIAEKTVEISPMRGLASQMTVSGPGSSVDLPREDGVMATDVFADEETAPRDATTASTFTNINIPFYGFSAQPQVTPWLLDDAAFNVEEWVSRKVASQIAKTEGQNFITGDGTGKPLGIADSGSGYSTTGTGGTSITADGLIDIFYAIAQVYRASGTWIAAAATIANIRQLKDGQSQYLWVPGFAATPQTILGRPVAEAVDMPADTTGLRPIAFGDWREAYLIVDKPGIRQVRDPYSDKKYIAFFTERRSGGAPATLEAARIGLNA